MTEDTMTRHTPTECLHEDTVLLPDGNLQCMTLPCEAIFIERTPEVYSAVNNHKALVEALTLATNELSAIRARDGAPQHIDWDKGRPIQVDGCSPKWWDELTEKCLTVLSQVGET